MSEPATVSSSRESKPLVAHEKVTGQFVVSSSDENERTLPQYPISGAAADEESLGEVVHPTANTRADLYKFESDEEAPSLDLRKPRMTAVVGPDEGSSSTEVESTPSQPYHKPPEDKPVSVGRTELGAFSSICSQATIDGRYIELGKASVVLEKVSPSDLPDVSRSSMNSSPYLSMSAAHDVDCTSMRVPPLKIIMPGSQEGQEEVDRFAQAKQSLPYILSSDIANSPKPDSTADNNSRDTFSGILFKFFP